MELQVVNAPLDANITAPTLDLADPVYLFEDDGVTELFRGFIIEREASSTQGVVTYVAYDLLFYTLKSKATYNFSAKTAEMITFMVCHDLGIPVGDLAGTNLNQKLIVQDTSIYEIIMQAYTQAYQQTGIPYRVNAKKGLLTVEEMGKVVCDIELTEDTNITSSQYKETIANMVNLVRIYDDEGNQSSVVQNAKDRKKYGTFQSVYTKEEGKDPKTTAKSMLKGVEKTFTLNCVNYNEAIAGTGLIIRDSSTGLSGLVWIDSDTHTWSNGVSTMSLTVTLQQVMDTKDPSEDSSIEVLYGSKDNPPFEIVNVYGRTERRGFSRFSDAFKYYCDKGGLATNWRILDKDGKEIRL